MGKHKIAKDDALFQLLGGLDELNSWIGFCRAGAAKTSKLKTLAGWLKEVQQALFIIQAEVAALGNGLKPKFKISKEKTAWLEKIIKEIDKKLPPLTKFIIPGASEISARIDVARVLARKTERAGKTLSAPTPNKQWRQSRGVQFCLCGCGGSANAKLSPELLQYLNRLSSFLFALARWSNYVLKIKEENPSYK